MRNNVMIAAALSLAGCGGGNEATPREVVTNAAAANDTVTLTENNVATTPAPPETPGIPAPTPSPTASPSPEPSEEASPESGKIPVALRGRWGLVPEDCTSTRGDAKGLLTITADTVRFYESRGALGEVIERSPNRIVADFAMSGEGQSWTRRMVFVAQDGGRTLVRRERGPDALLGLLRYSRCA